MIEAASPGAATLLAQLHARAFEKPWTEVEIAKLMENPTVFAFIHGDGAEAQGFVMGWAAGGDAEVLTVAVAPEARRKGFGAALVTAVGVAAHARGAATIHLEVAEDNFAARALYAKLGYAESGRRRAYYAGVGGAVDAIVMRCALPRP
ncbi:MAG: hypothetical protein A4S17_10920 [Proteobacteria bacterium HN_bin10]|nr:MAG: hypothetical protein A4S17_10920 [Proteobacteria bacterium HN_bin10]